MKISAIEYYPTSKKGGSEKAFLEVLVGLKKRGHDIHIFYVKPGDLLIEYDKTGIKHTQLPDTEIKYTNISNWLNFIKAARIINTSSPDCIYINQLSDSALAAICKLSKKVKIICHLRVPKQGNSRLFNITGKLVDSFICVNHLIKQQYFPYFKNQNMLVISDAINISTSPTLSSNKSFQKKAVYLGRISPEKGILELLDTWVLLKEKYLLNIHLDITGPSDTPIEQEYKAEVNQKILKKGLGHLVSVQSPISNPIEYFRGYDFSVFPSIIDEAFGRTLPESILAGTPVFARKVGIVEEILAPNKEALVYKTNAELAERISIFYEGELEYQIEKLQSHIISNYDINKTVLLIEKAFDI